MVLYLGTQTNADIIMFPTPGEVTSSRLLFSLFKLWGGYLNSGGIRCKLSKNSWHGSTGFELDLDSNLFHLFGVAAADQQEEGDDVIAEQEQEAVDEEAVGHGHLGNAGSRRSQIYSSKEV